MKIYKSEETQSHEIMSLNFEAYLCCHALRGPTRSKNFRHVGRATIYYIPVQTVRKPYNKKNYGIV